MNSKQCKFRGTSRKTPFKNHDAMEKVLAAARTVTKETVIRNCDLGTEIKLSMCQRDNDFTCLKSGKIYIVRRTDIDYFYW